MTRLLEISLENHKGNQVDIVAELSDSMLDLQPSVHLQEEELASFIVYKEFNCPHRLVVKR